MNTMSLHDHTIVTNNVPRDVIDDWQLTQAERGEFDYLDWTAIDEGRDSASFFRYRGELYDLGEFERTSLPGWDGQQTDTYFSATLIRYADESCETVVVGRYYS